MDSLHGSHGAKKDTSDVTETIETLMQFSLSELYLPQNPACFVMEGPLEEAVPAGKSKPAYKKLFSFFRK